MSVKPFSEVEAAFELSDFERKWHGKKTKLSKVFWTLVCHSHEFSYVEETYRIDVIQAAYADLFYLPFEACNWIREQYVGEKTSDIKSIIDFEQIESRYREKTEMAMRGVFDIVIKVPSCGINSKKPSPYTEIDIEEWDDYHPHLPSASECLEGVISTSSYFGREKNNISALNFDLKSTHINELNEAAGDSVRSLILLKAVHHIKQHCENQHIFENKIKVEGATDALNDALLFNPEIRNWADKRIKYYLENKYCLEDGSKLSSVQKAIRRFREEDNE